MRDGFLCRRQCRGTKSPARVRRLSARLSCRFANGRNAGGPSVESCGVKGRQQWRPFLLVTQQVRQLGDIRRNAPRLWIVGGLSGAIQIGLLVRLSYPAPPRFARWDRQTLRSVSTPAGRILLTAKPRSLAIFAAIDPVC